MRETKWYCDVCKKEIDGDPRSSYISIPENVGRHGKSVRTIRIMDNKGNFLDFCEDCKATIAILFGGSDDKAD